MIPNEMIVGKLNENIFLFDQKSIYKIIDNQGNILFSSDKSLITAEKATIIALSKTGKVINSKPAKIISGTAMVGLVVIVIIPTLLFFLSLF